MKKPSLIEKLRAKLKKKDERGIALFMALFALLLLAAIAMGMMFLANTETAINYNYRDAQRTYFASQAGLEVVRDQMRTQVTLVPRNLPSTSNVTGVLYILNDASAQPWNHSDPNYDYELCHEFNT